MRHSRANRKLGRPSNERLALLKNQVTNLFLHGKIITTQQKAKETKRAAEKTLTAAIKNDLEARPPMLWATISTFVFGYNLLMPAT